MKSPKGHKIVDYKWIFKKKTKHGLPRLESTQYKACLVVKGFSYKERIDFNEVLSIIVMHNSIHVLLVVVALFDLELE